MDYLHSEPNIDLHDGKYTDGNPLLSIPASRDPAAFNNAVTEEIRNVIIEAEMVPDELVLTQLRDAVKALAVKAIRAASSMATEALRGVLRIGTQAEVDAGTLDDVIVTPKKLRHGFTLLLASNGYLLLPTWMGSFLIQWGNVTAGVNASSGWPITTYTTPFPTSMIACFAMHTGSGALSTGVNFIVDTMTNSLTQFRAGCSHTSNQNGRYIAFGV